MNLKKSHRICDGFFDVSAPLTFYFIPLILNSECGILNSHAC